MLEQTYRNPHSILPSYKKDVQYWLQVKLGDAKAFLKFYSILLKFNSVTNNQHWIAVDTPQMLYMLLSKYPAYWWSGRIERFKTSKESNWKNLI